uniref:PilC/PilY family type IV pilus protein n=1 Tax=Candidatus Electronema sp. TaxID=2698783 RepID=UPI004055C0EE
MKMKHCAGLSFLTGILLLPAAAFAADVCNQGIGIPPFLSSGAKPNLLMVLDNSGSMLDAAYSKEDIRCLDGDYQITKNKAVTETVTGYDNAATYGGYFSNSEWYTWKDGEYLSWKSGTDYVLGSRVSEYGNIYQAVTAGKSIGASIDKDTGVEWIQVLSFPRWTSALDYPAGSFVWKGPQLYYAVSAVSKNGIAPDAAGSKWEPVKHSWRIEKAYTSGNIVSYNGIYYQALGSNSGKAPDENPASWKSLRQGQFERLAARPASASAACSGSGTKYTRTDALCITVDNAATPKKVISFVARGNFLNWAMASKFDIQKKILTGGKHNYNEKALVAEHRGCSGSRFIKQVKLDGGEYLSFGVRGSKYGDNEQPFLKDRVDTTDDTARLEILAITAAGFQPSKECQDMIVEITTKPQSGANWSNAIKGCLDTFPTANTELQDQRPILNHSLQFCSALKKDNIRNINVIKKECENLYTGTGVSKAYDPAELDPAYGAYFCYGVYDKDFPPTERTGYIGRCWQPPTGRTKTCVAKPAVVNTTCPNASNKCRYSASAKDWFKNEGGYNYKCSKTTDKSCDINVAANWTLLYMWQKLDGTYEGTCTGPNDIPPGATPAQWSTWAGPPVISADDCITQAAIDYCNDTSVPEVIDPSDQAGDTTTVWNIPGVLTDSQIMAQLGGVDPLAVMKGYIKQETRPTGVVHNVKKDLRLGMMSLHYVGAATECLPENLTPGIERFCPPNNKDGAELLTSLKEGDLVVGNDATYEGGKRQHVHELAAAINGVRGTSWTPLAEGLYSALGYYTQNPKFCLNKDANGKCDDFPTDKDPVQYWCQDNHILLITEGESTADISKAVQDFTKTPSTHFVDKQPDDIVTGTGDVNPQVCGGSLFRSAYLDDMTWWGQHVPPLYKERHVLDADGREKDKKNIYTHVVTTGTLNQDGTGQCSPEALMTAAAQRGGTTAYYPGENPQKLEDNLYAVLADILTRSSAGSAASVISSSRSGSGAAYQAVFWPKHEDKDPDKNGMSNKVTWVGDVHALFVSADGRMYEDTNQDGKLDGSDNRVIFYFSTNGKKTRGCYEALVPVPAADGSVTFQCPVDPPAPDECDGSTCVEIQEIKYIWSANKRLREIEDNDIPSKRKIFTWNDANNDGVVDKEEWFKLSELNKDKWEELNARVASAVSPRGPVTADFLAREDWGDFVEQNPGKTDAEMEIAALKALTDWLQGIDHFKDQFNLNVSDRFTPKDVNADGIFELPLRSRQFTYGDKPKTWRLGDIIHSTPIVVSRPAESYHYLYRDPTYAKFASHYANRRHMVYFGGNDGMLHAVNGGFYVENGNQFCLTEDCSAAGSSTPALGDEMWAYIPYNLQPHLKCLADRFYAHKYFVDQKPRIFDAQIFAEDADHPGGWGTILVGSMRFGGAPIQAKDLNGMDGAGDPTKKDQREFTSAYFILDITNPEKDPVLLGELTRTTENGDSKYVKLNYTTSSPAMIIMREGGKDDARSAWYLVMGNGPTDQDGTNTGGEHGKLAVLPLSRLAGEVSSWSKGVPNGVSAVKQSFRIPNSEPGGDKTGVFEVPVPAGVDRNTSGSFLSDIISVDYNIDMANDLGDDLGVRYCTDAVYFGTVDGLDFAQYPSGYRPDLPDDQFYWKGNVNSSGMTMSGGRLFRLVTKEGGITASGDFKEAASTPSVWKSRWTDGTPLRRLADVKMPVIGSPSIGYDGDNYWIYTGTGRFFGEKDKTDDGWCQDTSANCDNRSRNAFFGLKEPVAKNGDGFSEWAFSYATNKESVTCANSVMTWREIAWDVKSRTNRDLDPDQDPGQRGLMRTDHIMVEASAGAAQEGEGDLWCMGEGKCLNDVGANNNPCENGSMCFPSPNSLNKLKEIKEATTRDSKDVEVYTFDKLRDYIAGKSCGGIDGWYHVFQDARERNIGTSALLGGLLTFTTYQPYNDKCTAEGGSYLYGLHYQTGTAWTKSVFGTYDVSAGGIRILKKDGKYVSEKMSLGTGLSTAPSLHVGTQDGAKAFIQTSTGEIIEVTQENLPLQPGTKSGRINWTDRCYQSE